MRDKRTQRAIELNIQLSLEKESQLYLELADSRQRQIAFYLSLARKFASSLALDISRQARNLAYERATDLTSDLTNAYTQVLSSKPDKDLALDLAIAMSLALSLEDTLNPELGLKELLVVSRDLANLLAHDSASADGFVQQLDHALDVKANFAHIENAPGTGLNIGRLITKSIILIREILKLSDAPILRLTFQDPQNSSLTPAYLNTTVTPYINALVQIQHIIDEVKRREPTNIEILAIHPGSVTVDITGGIRDTVELIFDLVVPWRRKNQKQLAQLDVATKEIELKQKETEVKRARAILDADTNQADADADKALAEADLLRQQARKLALENKEKELELLDLTLAMVDKIQSGLPDNERFYYATQLIDPTRFIAISPLELTDVDLITTDDTAISLEEE